MTGTALGGEGQDRGSWWRRHAALAAVTSALIVLAILATGRAVSQIGVAFPSLVVDPFGSYSAVYLPSWGTPGGASADAFRPRFPDKLVEIEGQLLDPGGGRFPSETISAEVARRAESGATAITLVFEQEGQKNAINVPIRRFGADDVVFLFGLYGVAAMFVLWSGVMVTVLAERRVAARAYAFWSVGAVLFLLTFFDYHTTVRYVPLFSMSVVWIAVGFLALAWYFPESPTWASRARWPLRLLMASCAALSLWLVFAPAFGRDPSQARILATYLAPASGVILVGALLARLRRSSQRNRREIRAALWGIALVPALAGVGLALPSINGVGAIHLIAPFLVPLIPLSLGYSLIRHNVLATRAVLTRRMMIVPIVMAALFGAMVVWLVWRGSRGLLGTEQGAPLAAAILVFGGLCLIGKRFSTSFLFRATAEFRPSIQQITDALSSSWDKKSLPATIESVVLRWLPSRSAALLDVAEAAVVANLPPNHHAVLESGEYLWTEEDAWTRKLLVPARSQGVLRGVIMVSSSEEGGLFTSEDIELLRTIASLGAVALHNAEVMQDIDGLRRLQVEAGRHDKERALGTLGAELSHEIMGPLSFFRFLLNRAGGARALDPEDLATGQAEVERLERMLDNLRRFQRPTGSVDWVSLRQVVDRAARILTADGRTDRSTSIQNDVAAEVTIRGDTDGLVQVLFNLIRNGAEAAGAAGTVRVSTRRRPDRRLEVEVRDSGPGVPPALEKSLFNPWVTTKEHGSGLGLAITQRIVRSLGWAIHYDRSSGVTCLIVTITEEDARPDREGRELEHPHP